MAKGLRNMTPAQRDAAIKRRLEKGTKGNGYWAAVDALKQKAKAEKKEKNG